MAVNRQQVYVFCDESLQRGGYDLLGGIWATYHNAKRFRRTLSVLRRHHRYVHEFKWTRVGGRVSPSYRDAIEKTMQYVNARRIAFHCIVIRRSDIDLQTYHLGDHELSYYKFLNLLLHKRVEPGCEYHIALDRRTTRRSDRLSDLKKVLNAWTRRELGIGYDCCASVRALDSKQDDLLQIADLLLGAVGYHVAESHLLPNASRGKMEIADQICSALGRRSLGLGTPAFEQCFNVWRWSPEAGSGRSQRPRRD